jgi:hypothetical protein
MFFTFISLINKKLDISNQNDLLNGRFYKDL